MSRKSWIIFAVLVIGFFGVIYYFSNNDKIDLANVDITKVVPASETTGNIAEHIYGKKDAKIVLVEYGDYQCAGCASMSKKVKKLSEEYKDQVTFIFRIYTMDGHPNSLSSAAAAESAGLQNKYWQMHDLIYENQSDWANASVDERNDLYLSYARELGLDEAKFTEGMKDPNVRKKIEFDKATAKKAELNATPYFLLDGKKIETDIWGDDEKMRETINEALKSSGIKPPIISEDK